MRDVKRSWRRRTVCKTLHKLTLSFSVSCLTSYVVCMFPWTVSRFPPWFDERERVMGSNEREGDVVVRQHGVWDRSLVDEHQEWHLRQKLRREQVSQGNWEAVWISFSLWYSLLCFPCLAIILALILFDWMLGVICLSVSFPLILPSHVKLCRSHIPRLIPFTWLTDWFGAGLEGSGHKEGDRICYGKSSLMHESHGKQETSSEGAETGLTRLPDEKIAIEEGVTQHLQETTKKANKKKKEAITRQMLKKGYSTGSLRLLLFFFLVRLRFNYSSWESLLTIVDWHLAERNP